MIDVDVVTGFAGRLRARGLSVPPDTLVTYARALDAVGLDEREPVYWAGRATLARSPEDVPAYDAAFHDFWEGRGDIGGGSNPVARPPRAGLDGGDVVGSGSGGDADDVLRWSAAEVLRERDLATLTDDERRQADRLIDSLRWRAPLRRTRRRHPADRGEIDLRRTLAQSRRVGGEPLVLARRAPGKRQRRVVLLVDVSGSMSAYARALLRFAHVAVQARHDVEVFSLGTRLTRLTARLRTRDADAALAMATAAVPDYEGGTRLSDTIGEFTDRYGVRGMARGAVLVVLSDGWDRGDPARLGESMARLSLVVHKLIWVNPLKASEGYEPIAGGMAAALPYVDELVDGHAVASLEALAGALAA